MQKIITEIKNQSRVGLVYDSQLSLILGGTSNRRHSWVKRAVSQGALLSLRRGLYALSPGFLGHPLNPYVMAQAIYGPSYISLESALSWHGLIPEAVRTLTSVSYGRSKNVQNDLGLFSYIHIPQINFFAGVEEKSDEFGSFFIASPLKALADYVYVSKKTWRSLQECVEDLRLDESIVQGWKPSDVESLLFVYSGQRVRQFLKTIQKELRP